MMETSHPDTLTLGEHCGFMEERGEKAKVGCHDNKFQLNLGMPQETKRGRPHSHVHPPSGVAHTRRFV